jgi:hypothetical protein
LSYRVKPNCSNVNKKNLISGIRLTYKVIPQILKENKIIFLEFLKYWPRSCDFNKLVIKAKMPSPAHVAGLDPAGFYSQTCVNNSRTAATVTV